MKSLKTWKTIIQFIITVLTAIVSSFAVQGCFNGNENETLRYETRGYETASPGPSEGGGMAYENENFSTSQHSARREATLRLRRTSQPLNTQPLNSQQKCEALI